MASDVYTAWKISSIKHSKSSLECASMHTVGIPGCAFRPTPHMLPHIRPSTVNIWSVSSTSGCTLSPHVLCHVPQLHLESLVNVLPPITDPNQHRFHSSHAWFAGVFWIYTPHRHQGVRFCEFPCSSSNRSTTPFSAHTLYISRHWKMVSPSQCCHYEFCLHKPFAFRKMMAGKFKNETFYGPDPARS